MYVACFSVILELCRSRKGNPLTSRWQNKIIPYIYTRVPGLSMQHWWWHNIWAFLPFSLSFFIIFIRRLCTHSSGCRSKVPSPMINKATNRKEMGIGLVPVLHFCHFLRIWLAVRHDRGHSGSTAEQTYKAIYNIYIGPMWWGTPHRTVIIENPYDLWTKVMFWICNSQGDRFEPNVLRFKSINDRRLNNWVQNFSFRSYAKTTHQVQQILKQNCMDGKAHLLSHPKSYSQRQCLKRLHQVPSSYMPKGTELS